MDYILFGMGFGASLMLLGWALRTFGPAWKYADVSSDDPSNRYVYKRFWNRFVQGLGGVLAIAGSAMVILTFLVMLLNPADETGELFALVVWISIVLIIFGWCWAYMRRYGTTGIWSREEGYGFRSQSPKVARAARVSPRASAPVVEHISESDPVFESPEPELGTSDDQLIEAIDEVPELEVEAAADSTDSDYDFGDSADTTVPSESGGRELALQRLRERQEQGSEE
ncbi:MAG: hypothetical protein KC435_10330 [Thermomicrobiales bacterium]|nr:hypothetical protein [Thermomicrobiales bacterium]